MRRLLTAALLCCAVLAGAQELPLFVRPTADVLFPLDQFRDSTTGKTTSLYTTGFAAGSIVDWKALPWLVPFVRGQYGYVPYLGGNSLKFTEGAVGVGLVGALSDRFALRLDTQAGVSEVFLPSLSGSVYSAGARVGLDYRVAPAFTLSASGGYSGYFGSQASVLSAITAGVSFTYSLSALGGEKARVAVQDIKLDAVFPSLYAYYDDNPFGSVTVVNREDAAIEDVHVSFSAGHYMDQPKVCGVYDSLKAGASVVVPVKALFTDSVLNITQGLDAKGEIIVSYVYLGSARTVRVPIDFRMHHRNAITWSDDRRAASFVSPNNPAAQWFARFATGIVNDRLRAEINKPLQYAMGLFEAERLYGLNYVLVPANDYSVKHGIKDYIDSVQFPHQTLTNRGGDCSDLAILFASLMQSVGVEAAFITVPGHIYAAFDTGLTEDQARQTFSDAGLLIFEHGKVWIPVEITMVKDGFIKAWRVGAKEWADNTAAGTAAFYPLPECWAKYPSTSFPDVNPRFVLPDQTAMAVAFDGTVDRYVAREIDPQVQLVEARDADQPQAVRDNEVGILYAQYGLLSQAWGRLAQSAKSGLKNAWTNLGNVAFLQKNFKLALTYFQYAGAQDPDDDYALLGLARSQYELDDYLSSDQSYRTLKTRNPALAAKFGYLGSIYGGEGRAWSLADRFATTSWSRTSPASVSMTDPRPGVADRLPGEADAAPPPAAYVTLAPSTPRLAMPAYPALPTPVVLDTAAEATPEVAAAPPVQTPDQWRIIGRGFSATERGPGTWKTEGDVIRQIDPDEFFAKLIGPSPADQTVRYSFSARSLGRGWVGLGLHVLVGGVKTHTGWGEGDSWLVWLTRDPVHFAKDQTRIQIYHSTSDTQMTLLADQPVAVSIRDWNRLSVETGDALTITLNDAPVASVPLPARAQGPGLIALRSIDKAEFQDFLIEAKP
jgi:tetratricopeptide (TPR) repeat protein